MLSLVLWRKPKDLAYPCIVVEFLDKDVLLLVVDRCEVGVHALADDGGVSPAVADVLGLVAVTIVVRPAVRALG